MVQTSQTDLMIHDVKLNDCNVSECDQAERHSHPCSSDETRCEYPKHIARMKMTHMSSQIFTSVVGKMSYGTQYEMNIEQN